ASFTARIAATESPSTTSFHAARCAAAAPGSRPSGTRSRASVSCSDGPRLETEDLLDLVPQHEDQREGEGREDHGRDEEAKPRAGPLAPTLHARAAPRAIVPIRLLDRRWIDRRLVRRRGDAAGWLGHPGAARAGLPRGPR